MNDFLVEPKLLRHPGLPRILRDVSAPEIYDPRLADVIDCAAPLLCLYDQASFSEGTTWDAPRERLIWSDIVGRRVLGWYPDGRVEVVIDATHFINGNAVARDNGLVHCEHGRRCISRSGPDGAAIPFITHFEGRRFNSPNDVVCAPDGAIWFTDPTFGLNMPTQGSLAESDLDHQSLYRYDPDSGEARRMADFEQPNGLAFSPDGCVLYVSDTSRALDGDKHEILRFAVANDGSLSDRHLFLEIEPGIPDGFRVDRRGWIWTTSGGGIQIFAEDATPLGVIPTPNSCANCAFDVTGRRLFIAAEHLLLAIDLR